MMGSIYVIYYMVILSQQVLLRQNPKMNLFYSRNDYEIDEKFYLKDSDFKLQAQIVNNTFDNDDNPYIKIKFFLYSHNEAKELDTEKCDTMSLVSDDITNKWYKG